MLLKIYEKNVRRISLYLLLHDLLHTQKFNNIALVLKENYINEQIFV